jgi:hypothetical protein
VLYNVSQMCEILCVMSYNVWKMEGKMLPKEKIAVDSFAAQWEAEQGYKPAPFQKAIALQRIRRGQDNREIIDSLVAQRV